MISWRHKPQLSFPPLHLFVEAKFSRSLVHSFTMGTERKRKVSLFDVMEDPSAKNNKSNVLGGASAAAAGISNLINKWNGKPYSQRYYDILEKRRDLPVWLQKDEFLRTLQSNQTLILVGETGSGKTTQVRLGMILIQGLVVQECEY